MAGCNRSIPLPLPISRGEGDLNAYLSHLLDSSPCGQSNLQTRRSHPRTKYGAPIAPRRRYPRRRRWDDGIQGNQDGVRKCHQTVSRRQTHERRKTPRRGASYVYVYYITHLYVYIHHIVHITTSESLSSGTSCASTEAASVELTNRCNTKLSQSGGVLLRKRAQVEWQTADGPRQTSRAHRRPRVHVHICIYIYQYIHDIY